MDCCKPGNEANTSEKQAISHFLSMLLDVNFPVILEKLTATKLKKCACKKKLRLSPHPRPPLNI